MTVTYDLHLHASSCSCCSNILRWFSSSPSLISLPELSHCLDECFDDLSFFDSRCVSLRSGDSLLFLDCLDTLCLPRSLSCSEPDREADLDLYLFFLDFFVLCLLEPLSSSSRDLSDSERLGDRDSDFLLDFFLSFRCLLSSSDSLDLERDRDLLDLCFFVFFFLG